MKQWQALLLAGFLVLSLAACATQDISDPGRVIETTCGPVRGFPDREHTWSWKGIPYATPPVGSLRWKAPRPPDPWIKPLDAFSFGSPCAQKPFPDGPVLGNEDCLTLNIWRPQSEETDLPVYVFIHGGGNANGSSGLFPDYHGAILADSANLVFVSLNYRLGPFGWFLHPALAAESAGNPTDSSGNYGLLDIILALKWVRNNITAFGGDPDNVTIAGQSAGGADVLALMLSDMASGLFHRAACESGAVMTSAMAKGYERGEEVFRELLIDEGAAADAAGAERIASALSTENTAEYLRGRSPEDILDQYTFVPEGLSDFPFNFTDGTVIPEEGFGAFTEGTYPNAVPLIIGSNRDDFSLFLLPRTPAEGLSARHRSMVALGSRLWKADAVDALARSLSEQEGRPPVYAYHFIWGSDHRGSNNVLPAFWSSVLGAAHSLEIPFFTGNHSLEGNSLARPLFTRENRKGRTELSERMMQYLSNFVRTGNPNLPEVPESPWLPWSNTPTAEKYIIFDAGFKTADMYMSYDELYAEDILNFYGRYMSWEDFNTVMDRVFWR